MGRSVEISIAQAAALLREQDNILILCHKSPDGDTLGSGFALLHGLLSLGKQAKVECSDPIPERFAYLFPERALEIEPKYVVAVDVADTNLLGDKLSVWSEKVDLCIDHHGSNRRYADKLLLEGDSAAACEVVYLLLQVLGVVITPKIADCIYTGIATDTGCFRYSNTSIRTHRMAAELMERGCRFQKINQWMFETVRPSRLAVEREALATLEYAFSGRCALITLDRAMIEKNGASDDELDGISAIPRQIQGVQVGVTMKQVKDRSGYKISMRTTEEADASAICARLGGGGHARAAGCMIPGSAEQAKAAILKAVAEQFQEEPWTES